MTPLRVAVVSGTRADYGLLRPTLKALEGDPRFELLLIVTAMHLEPAFGSTVRDIEDDALPIAARVPLAVTEESAHAMLQRTGRGVEGIGAELERLGADVLVVLGDRHEMLSAALAATALGVPIVHLHGGELSEGSLDDAMRHCITKLSHLHLVAARAYAERVCQMGEEPWRVHVVGAAGLEAIRGARLLDRAELAAALDLELGTPLIVVTFHPASLAPGAATGEARELLAAVEDAAGESGSIVITLPNDDPGASGVRAELVTFAQRHPRALAVESLGSERYLSLLRCADAVVGNSSSGLIEAPAFGLPTVDVGERQAGRLAGDSVLRCRTDRAAIAAALSRALDPEFRRAIENAPNPYGDGEVSERVLELLAQWARDEHLRLKRFHDLPDAAWRAGLRLSETP